jgi:low affinity Fe/Cu permease
MIRKIYKHSELIFEKIANFATLLLSNSITFFLALCLVIYWFANKHLKSLTSDELIRDVIHAVTFLSLFIIQKSFNRFSAFLHIKVNELIVSDKKADNAVLHLEHKTEQELTNIVKVQLETEIESKEKQIQIEASNPKLINSYLVIQFKKIVIYTKAFLKIFK